jgi:AAA family ATP:ADP antiporter
MIDAQQTSRTGAFMIALGIVAMGGATYNSYVHAKGRNLQQRPCGHSPKHPMQPSPTSPSHGLLRRLMPVRAGEEKLVLLAMSYFFLLMLGYYMLRPLREAMAIAKGADKLPWLMTGTLSAMLLANPAFAALVSRLPRRRFIPTVYRFFAANLLAFWLLFNLLPGHGGAWLGYGFYIWLSVYSLFVVSVFWGLMADLFQQEAARRLFGLIAVGGTLGAIAGAAATDALTRGHFFAIALPWRAGPATLTLLSAVALELATQCMSALGRACKLGDQAGGPREPGPGLWTGLRLVTQSRYLALIGGFMLLFTITSTLLYMQQGAIVAATFQSQEARTAAFARIDLYVNLLTLIIQFLVTGRVVAKFGLRAALMLLPVLTITGFGVLWIWPSFAVLAAFQVARRGLHYAVDRPAREMLYVPLGPDEKYKSKPFIDTFIYRCGDILGAWTTPFLAWIAIPAGAAAVVISVVWLYAAAMLGRMHRDISKIDNPAQ